MCLGGERGRESPRSESLPLGSKRALRHGVPGRGLFGIAARRRAQARPGRAPDSHESGAPEWVRPVCARSDFGPVSAVCAWPLGLRLRCPTDVGRPSVHARRLVRLQRSTGALRPPFVAVRASPHGDCVREGRLGGRGLGLAHRIQSRAPSGVGPTVDLRRSGSQTRRSLTRPSPARAELDGLPHGNAVECSERQKGGFLASVFPGENPGPRHPGSGSKALLSSIAFAEKSPEARRASSNAHRPGSIPRGPPELRRRLPRSPTLA